MNGMFGSKLSEHAAQAEQISKLGICVTLPSVKLNFLIQKHLFLYLGLD